MNVGNGSGTDDRPGGLAAWNLKIEIVMARSHL